MKIPLQITFRGISPSEAVEACIDKRIEALERHHRHVIGCRVLVEAHHRQHQRGRRYQVRIDLTVPGHKVVISREPSEDNAYQDVYVAVREAFDEMERSLEGSRRRIRRVPHVQEDHRKRAARFAGVVD